MGVEKLIAFDPGGSTGYACWHESTQFMETGVLTQVGHHCALWDLLQSRRPAVVIYEQFVYQRRDIQKGVALNIDARNYIGVIELYAKLNGCILYESALAHKKFWDDRKLRQLNLYDRSIHARDATRHLLHYLTFKMNRSEWVSQLRPGS